MSTTPLNNEDSTARPSRAVVQILKSYGFDPALKECEGFPNIDMVVVMFSHREDEEVGTVSIVDILNENGYSAWFSRGQRTIYITRITPATPGVACSKVSRM